MKKIIFFDVDNTIFSSKLRKVHLQTSKLIKELSKDKDTVLCFATGRGMAKIGVINDFLDCFTYGITVNGAVIHKGKEIIYSKPIKTEDVKEVSDFAKEQKISIGMVGDEEEAVNFLDPEVMYGLKGFNEFLPIVDPEFYMRNEVFQIWIFKENKEEVSKFAAKFKQFTPYFWNIGGVDLVYPETNKANAIKKIMEDYPGYKLICVGDGHNDIDMIKLADIGIVMGNTRNEELKEAASFISPHIDDDKLYDFFKEIGLV